MIWTRTRLEVRHHERRTVDEDGEDAVMTVSAWWSEWQRDDGAVASIETAAMPGDEPPLELLAALA